MKIRDLIAGLKRKDQNAEVQFIVTQKADGAIVAMNLEGRNIDMGKLVAFFGSPKPTPTQNLHDALLAHWYALQDHQVYEGAAVEQEYDRAVAAVRAALATQRVGV